MDAVSELSDRRRYARQIERLHQRHLLSSRLYELRQDGVSLASVIMRRGRVSRLMAREVAAGRYRLEPGELRTIRARHKLRQVYACRLTDLIVHGAVADIVQDATAADLSPRVYSYRRGISPTEPVKQLAAYIRATRRAEPDARRRGLYVLRRDVDSYTDSIPLDAASPLWGMLERRMGAPLPQLVEQVIRAELRLPDGGVVCRLRGLPLGQPISSVLANLYLGDLDRALEAIPGGFYARYGDDFIFAHPEAAVVREADAIMDAELVRLRLTVNDSKRRTVYLTPAGIPAPDWPQARGGCAVPFLGARIAADGTVGLDRKKVRSFLRELDRRITTTLRTLPAHERDDAGPALCAVVNQALDPRSALAQHKSALLLRRVVTDRKQLEQLDYWIAHMIAEAISGRRGARAFRSVPYRMMREEWGLLSLVAARNARRVAA